MTAPADASAPGGGRDLLDLALEHGIPAAEGAEALVRVIEGTDLPQVVASSIDLQALLQQVQDGAGPGPRPPPRTPARPRRRRARRGPPATTSSAPWPDSGRS